MSTAVRWFNVGGTVYATTEETLARHKESLLFQLGTGATRALHDAEGRVFIDRDGQLFRFILDFMRHGEVLLPSTQREVRRLRSEAKYFQLSDLCDRLDQLLTPESANFRQPSCITIGYRGSFSCGREGITDLRFRKLGRILVHGPSDACKEIFGDHLNDTRDPDIGNQYSCRFFLNNSNLEHAFDLLLRSGYRMITSCASGTNSGALSNDVKMASECEELRWQHYNEFVFINSPL